MSEVSVENFWRGTAAYNEGDWDAALAMMDPDVVFDLTHAAPDGETYRGYGGVKAFWRMLREVFGDFEPTRMSRPWWNFGRPSTG
jgi:ketosteroid isomerase-like protein